MIPVVLGNLGRTAYEQGDAARAIALLRESERWFREVGHRENLTRALGHLAPMVYAQGDNAQARALLRECLGLQQQLGQKGGIAQSLAGFAALAARQQRPERAVRLLGAAAALCAASDLPRPSVRADYEHDLATARAQLDAASLAAAWAAGQAMSLEQAISYALEGD
jgi:non-specific serine/threonine protein kinase